MSTFNDNIVTRQLADLIGFGATLNPDGSISAITGPTIRVVTGDPNGVVSANTASLALRDDTGQLYSNTGGTTWAERGGGLYAQTISSTVSADTSISGGSPFADLLSFDMTTTGGDVEILATFAAQRSGGIGGGQGFLQIAVDGGGVRGCGPDWPTSTSVQSGAISIRVSLAPGLHTIALQARVAVQLTLRFNALSNPDAEHATLTARELAA